MPSNTHMLIYAEGSITFRQHPNEASCRVLWGKLSRLATSTTIGNCIAWQIQTILHFSSRVWFCLTPANPATVTSSLRIFSLQVKESAWKTALHIDPDPFHKRIDLLQCYRNEWWGRVCLSAHPCGVTSRLRDVMSCEFAGFVPPRRQNFSARQVR